MTVRKLTIPLSKEQEKRIKDLSMQYKEEEITALGSSLVPFKNEFPKDTKLYKLMSTKPGENR